jgi:hypothetical protein
MGAGTFGHKVPRLSGGFEYLFFNPDSTTPRGVVYWDHLDANRDKWKRIK